MPSHLKPCILCGQPFAAGETRQPHPNADGIGYSKVHKRCAAQLTRKGRAAASVPAKEPEPPSLVSVPQDETAQAPPAAEKVTPEQAAEDAGMQEIEDAEVADIARRRRPSEASTGE